MQNDYAYTMDLFREDGTAIGQCSLTPEWGPALEWVYFEGVRAGLLSPVIPTNPVAGPACVEPVWHPTAGRPYASAFRVAIPANGSGFANGSGTVSREIPTAYVRPLAQQASAALVEKGLLGSGESFRYLVCAFPACHAPEPARGGGDLAIVDAAQPLALSQASLDAFRCGATAAGDHATGDMPVFIPQRVLDEVMALGRQAGDVETGGVLVGHLHRDPAIPDIFVEVTAQIPAAHTQADSTRLTFTADTWAAVRAALALRRRGEVMVGWHHFHPAPCVMHKCPPEKRAHCTASSAFFSADDVALHTALFARAYNVALLASDSVASGLGLSLFGWRHGMVISRGFYALPESGSPASPLPPAPGEPAQRPAQPRPAAAGKGSAAAGEGSAAAGEASAAAGRGPAAAGRGPAAAGNGPAAAGERSAAAGKGDDDT